MDPTLRNTPALLTRIDKLTTTLISRYLSLIHLAALPRTNRNPTSTNHSSTHDFDIEKAGIDTLRMELEVQGIVKAAEEITLLTRGMREGWLFGGLEGGGEGGIGESVEGDVRCVRGVLEGRIGRGMWRV